ncbi:MAG: FAD-dependent oxidoreductase, partial [Planctomycetota bacterium]|nr:FAD-dependent oxidoreductase [Planctomycetota bacterium]
MEYVTEPAKQVPVARDVDVVVAGSGISGLFASLAAARHGARVVLVDRMGMPGGNIGPGRIVGYGIGGSILSTQHERRYTGVVAEFIERLNKDLDDVPYTYSTMSHGVSRVAANMFEEEGVELVLSAYAADPIMDGDRACGLFVESKSGRIAIKAKVVIDATGDADTAARAGAPVRRRVTVEEISQDNVSAHPDHQHWND